MGRKILLISLTALIFLITHPKTLLASSLDYEIKDFESQLTINEDTSIAVTETIVANFNIHKHGIFRIIPTVYSAKGKTINARFKIISIEDENGNPYPFERSRLRQSVKLKIGDPDKTLTGINTYVIKYEIKEVILRYPTHDELYWNITGSEWDTTIENATATVDSPYAKINAADCFSGIVQSNEKNCEFHLTDDSAEFTSTEILGRGKDFSVVVALDTNNSLAFPGAVEKIIDYIYDNWGYVISLLPILFILTLWVKKGRDKRYLGENIYYKPDKPKTKTVSIFERKHLPLVYSPIQGLTPAQVGTIIDEKVDIHDVVSEIVELARLGYIKIKKTKKKGLVRKSTDYTFMNLKKDPKGLMDYQKYLLTSIFGSVDVKDKISAIFDLAKTDKTDPVKKDEVKLTDLKNKFYTKLEGFKKILYENMKDEKYFVGNPEKTRIKWIASFTTLVSLAFVANIFFAIQTVNFGPSIVTALTVLPGILLSKSMPRRTAWGYSILRQTLGLRWYLEKGKWRHEIMEKNMFFEEILPLAISLGVVNQLANQMKDLGVKPPNYFTGVATASLASDIKGFEKSASSTLVSSPKSSWSGSSSWSGGSGFSGGGGFSSGGFGGGGGGSW